MSELTQDPLSVPGQSVRQGRGQWKWVWEGVAGSCIHHHSLPSWSGQVKAAKRFLHETSLQRPPEADDCIYSKLFSRHSPLCITTIFKR